MPLADKEQGVLLLVAATEMEMGSLRQRLGSRDDIAYLVAGVGVLETAVNLQHFLHNCRCRVRGVLNFGVAGAFLDRDLAPLDICLAEQEVLGDLGICYETRFEPLSVTLAAVDRFPLDEEWRLRTAQCLAAHGQPWRAGTFVTVNCVSGSARRGAMLRDAHQGLCENMEGAAVARVCRQYGLPCLELRCISNMVEDRDTSKWLLGEAASKCREAVELVVGALTPSCQPL